MTRIAGFLTALGGANHFRSPISFGETLTESILTGLLMIVGGVAAVYAGARLSRFGRRHTTRLIKDAGGLEPGSYNLYLRPFDLDDTLYQIKPPPVRSWLRKLQTPLSRTFEEDMVLSLRFKLGRVVAVGKPGERLPLSGAQRFYLPLDNWKPTVSEAIRKARLVVLATGTSEGTLWEFTEAVRLLPPERLMVMVFTDEPEYDRFRSAAGAAFASRAAELSGDQAGKLAGIRWPEYPPLRNPEVPLRMVGTQGLIVFGPDWTPEFVRFDPTAVRALSDLGRIRKVVRRQVNPTVRRIKRGLAHAPAPGVIVPPPPAAGPAPGRAE
ncbi:hypothetical protein [Streptomyces werraensis]|uniref:hypothetical protein n=1 Tax=Streptomyces werraensis TaxID=68284 RepID=UPI00341B2609|nr:hypothetical protein [Streptomyces werraensis]